jgi:hypothetical protein
MSSNGLHRGMNPSPISQEHLDRTDLQPGLGVQHGIGVRERNAMSVIVATIDYQDLASNVACCSAEQEDGRVCDFCFLTPALEWNSFPFSAWI